MYTQIRCHRSEYTLFSLTIGSSLKSDNNSSSSYIIGYFYHTPRPHSVPIISTFLTNLKNVGQPEVGKMNFYSLILPYSSLYNDLHVQRKFHITNSHNKPMQELASVAQLDAPSDWRPGGRGFNPRWGRQHSFVEIDHEIFSTVILSLPLIQEEQLSVSGERMCTILVNCLED